MPDVTPDMLVAYFAAREDRRRQEIAAALPRLEEQIRTFLAEHGGDAGAPALLAGMIREVAVQAHARGVWDAGGKREDNRPDSVVLWDTLHYVREFHDLCPAWRMFDGRQLEEENDDA